MIRALLRWFVALSVAPCLVMVPSALADESADRLALAVDALTRLEGLDLNANPAMKGRVLQLLEKTRGTPNFVRLVRHFDLPDQEAGLLEVAIALPRDDSGVEALRRVIASDKTERIQAILEQRDSPKSVALAEALGNTGHKDSVKFLLPVLSDVKNGPALRRQAVQSLAKTADGARELLTLARSDRLPEDLKKAAMDELTQVRWPEIKSEATQLRGQSMVTIHSMVELLKMRGDPLSGERVFYRASPGCATCHIVNGRGTELGPNLSEIGSKLGKEALYQAILEPSAGISFGYEAFTVVLKDGDEAFGLISSETAEELAIKVVGGIVTRYKKSDVVSRRKSMLSIMPAGLEAGMTPQELADLIEFLASLKKSQ